MREPLIPQLDADEFVHCENRQAGKHELHHGFVVAFAGATVDHDTIAFNTRNALARAFPRPCRAFGPDVKVRVAETTFFYPDASVVRDDMPGNATVITAPILTCEILSESTRAYDLIDKRAAYHGVPTLRTYAIVHTRSRRIEIDSRTPSGDWSRPSSTKARSRSVRRRYRSTRSTSSHRSRPRCNARRSPRIIAVEPTVVERFTATFERS